MSDSVQTAFWAPKELLDNVDAVLARTGISRSVILRAAMERSVERNDISWLLVPTPSCESKDSEK